MTYSFDYEVDAPELKLCVSAVQSSQNLICWFCASVVLNVNIWGKKAVLTHFKKAVASVMYLCSWVCFVAEKLKLYFVDLQIFITDWPTSTMCNTLEASNDSKLSNNNACSVNSQTQSIRVFCSALQKSLEESSWSKLLKAGDLKSGILVFHLITEPLRFIWNVMHKLQLQP